MGLRVRRRRVLDVCVSQGSPGDTESMDCKGRRGGGGFEERDHMKMNGASQKTRKNRLQGQIPLLGKLILSST